jgi:predicted RNase H-like HicB family nuclease
MTDTWTREKKLEALLRLRWTITVEHNAEEGYLVAHLKELPDVIATGADERALARDLWESLTASLDARLDFEDLLVLPGGAQLPWTQVASRNFSIVNATIGGDAWEKVQHALKSSTVPVNSAASATAEVLAYA